jgi:hypothetical protein
MIGHKFLDDRSKKNVFVGGGQSLYKHRTNIAQPKQLRKRNASFKIEIKKASMDDPRTYSASDNGGNPFK